MFRGKDVDTLILITLAIACSTLFFGIVYSDSKLYIHMTRYFLGIAGINGIEGWVAARPLIPLIAALPSTFLWIP